MTPSSSALKQKTIQGLLWGGLSTLFQQALNLLFGIVLARVLTQEDYGIIGMLTIFSLIASTLQDSGFVSALGNKKEVSQADYNAVFWTSLGIGSSLYLLLFFAAPWIADFYRTPELIPLSRYLFLGFLIGSTGVAHNAYLFRNLKVKERAVSMTMGVLVSGIAGIILALNGFSYWGLATQNVLYIAVYTGMIWWFSGFRPSFQFDFRPIKSLFAFSSNVLFSNILNHINNNVLYIFLGRFYQKADVGTFTQANKWSTMSQAVVASMSHSFAQPLLADLADDKDRQVRVFSKLFAFVCFVTFPALFCLSISAKELITIAITDKWQESALLLSILAVGCAFLPLTNLFSNAILSKGNSRTYLYNILGLGLVQLLLIALFRHADIHSLALIVTGINIGWMFVWQYFANRLLGVGYIRLLGILLQYMLPALIAALVAFYIGNFIGSVYLRFLVKIALMLASYLVLLFLSKSVILQELISFLKEKRSK